MRIAVVAAVLVTYLSGQGVVTGTLARLMHGTASLPGVAVHHWRTAVPLVLGTAALMAWGDAPISSSVHSPGLIHASEDWSNRGLLIIEPAIFVSTSAVEARCLFCAPVAQDLERGTIAELYATASVQALKLGFGRERPYTPNDGDGGFNESGSSFPSGHAVGVFTLASLQAHTYPRAKWFDYAAYATAVTTGALRVTAREHFPSDVLVGSAMGFAIGSCAITCG